MLDNMLKILVGHLSASMVVKLQCRPTMEKEKAEFMGVFVRGITEFMHTGKPLITVCYTFSLMPI